METEKRITFTKIVKGIGTLLLQHSIQPTGKGLWPNDVSVGSGAPASSFPPLKETEVTGILSRFLAR